MARFNQVDLLRIRVVVKELYEATLSNYQIWTILQIWAQDHQHDEIVLGIYGYQLKFSLYTHYALLNAKMGHF